jgi:hypothetical protein
MMNRLDWNPSLRGRSTRHSSRNQSQSRSRSRPTNDFEGYDLAQYCQKGSRLRKRRSRLNRPLRLEHQRC